MKCADVGFKQCIDSLVYAEWRRNTVSGLAKQATGSKDLVLDFLEELRHGRIVKL